MYIVHQVHGGVKLLQMDSFEETVPLVNRGTRSRSRRGSSSLERAALHKAIRPMALALAEETQQEVEHRLWGIDVPHELIRVLQCSGCFHGENGPWRQFTLPNIYRTS